MTANTQQNQSTFDPLADGGRQTAVTGLGIISCLGNTLPDVLCSLKEGHSGIIADPARTPMFRSPLTGSIKNFSPKDYGLGVKKRRTMGQPAQYAYAATKNALADANLKTDEMSPDRLGLIFGNDSCIGSSFEAIDTVRTNGETRFLGTGPLFQVMNSTVSMNLAAAFNIGGANWTLSAACASSAHAIGQGMMLIRSGMQDVVLVGGAQETCWEGMACFDALGVFSMRTDEPRKASRPFDASRDGLVPSGGAACLVLEDLAHARKRGAEVYGIISGYGFSSDTSGSIFRPISQGAVRAMKMALSVAGVDAANIDYVNAHATSTPAGDLAELRAISEVFGSETPISSTKSITGHECWMAGASEALYTILSVKDGFIPGNVNFERLDDGCPKINVVSQSRPTRVLRACSNSMGFGGTNAAIVIDFEK